MDIGSIMGAHWALFGLMMAFGIGYNALIAWLEWRGWLEGFVSLAVAGGVGVTLLLVGFIEARAALLVLVSFGFTGIPMIIGSIVRYMERREKEQERTRGDKGKGLAE